MEIKKILLIDDDEDCNFLNTWILRKGVTEDIVSEKSAENALRYLSKNASEIDLLPDLILLDIRMPIMDGFTFLSEFEKMPPQVHEKCMVVILTSSFDRVDYDKAISNPYVTEVLHKPLMVEQVLGLEIKIA